MPFSVRRIDAVTRDDRHKAFPSLTRHDDQWWCTFRSGRDHVSHDGRAELWSRSVDDTAATWRQRHVFTSPDPKLPDLRDPRVLRHGRGFVVVATATSRRFLREGCQTWRWTSTDGTTWSDPAPVGDRNTWLWSLQPGPEGMALATTYPFRTARTEVAKETVTVWQWPLGSTELSPLAELVDGPLPNETTVIADQDGAHALVRTFRSPNRDGGPALLGRAPGVAGPWSFSDLGFFIGGPAVIRHDSTLVLGGRALGDRPARTVLWRCDDRGDSVATEELLTLPSGGDNGYPSFVSSGEELHLAYYSSHEGDTTVYFVELAPTP